MNQKKMDFNAKVIANYRITIPEVVRRYLEIEEGDIIKVEILKVIKKKDQW